MHSITLQLLFVALIFFIILSAFFSGSETGMMALNRYRLRHLVRKKHRAAIRVSRLLTRVDRLLGVILIGNTFANVLASALATLIAAHLFGNVGVLLATIILTLVILIFAEIIPKTVAATYPEKVAFLVSLPLRILLQILYPLVWLANACVGLILRLFGVKVKEVMIEPLSADELRTLVREAGGKIKAEHQDMLLSILDLEQRVVEDVMVPRSEVVGVDVAGSWERVLAQLTDSKHSRKIVYRNSIDRVQGVLHLPEIMKSMLEGKLSKTRLLRYVKEISFVPEGTSLAAQLVNFRKSRSYIALVVDEYGDIQGLISLADILQLIVGRMVLGVDMKVEIRPGPEGGFLVAGSTSIRELNRQMKWELPAEGPKTIGGLLIEYLELIPDTRVGVLIAGYPVEVYEVEGNIIKTVYIRPRLAEYL